MKPQFMLPCIVLFLGTFALAQHEMETSATQPPSEAQKSFTQLKSLAGTWRGSITVDPPQPQIKNGELGQITLRVTSRGNALVHACPRRSCGQQAHRATSLANVLWAVYRHRVLFPGTSQPPTETTFDVGASPPSVPDRATRRSAFVLGCAPAAFPGLLAGPSSLHECGSGSCIKLSSA